MMLYETGRYWIIYHLSGRYSCDYEKGSNTCLWLNTSMKEFNNGQIRNSK
jgi:hypothetical protein